MKISVLLNPALGNALNELSQKEVDVKTAFSIAQIMEERQTHLKVFEVARKALLERFCDKDEAGELKLNEEKTQFVINDKKAYDVEFDELTAIEVEMSVLEKASIEKLKSVTPSQIYALRPLIK